MSNKSGKKSSKGARKSSPQSTSGIQHTPNQFDALLAEDDAASLAETIPTCLQTAYNILRDEKNCLEDACEAYRTAIKQLGFDNANDLLLIKASPSELDRIYCTFTTKGCILLKQALDICFAKPEDQTEPDLFTQARKLAPDLRNSGLPDQAGRPSSHSSCALSFHGEEDDIFSITSNLTGGQSTLGNGKGSYMSTVYRKQQPLQLTSKTAAARERHLKLLSTTLIEHVGGSLRGSPSTLQFSNLLAGAASREGLPLMDILKAVHTLKLSTSSKKERLEVTQLVGPPEAVSHENRRGLEAYSQLVSRHPWSQSIAQVLKHLSYQKTLLKGSLCTFSPSRIECWKDHIDEFSLLVTSKIHLAMTSHPDDSTARQGCEGHIVMRALFLKMIYVLTSNAFANDDPSVLGGDNFDQQWRAHVERPSKFVYPTEFSVVEWESCLKLSGFSCPKSNCGLLGFTEGFCTCQETVSIKKDGLEARRKEAKDKFYSLPSTQALDQKDRGAAFTKAHGHLTDNSKTHSPKSKEEILTTMFKNQGSIKLPYNITP